MVSLWDTAWTKLRTARQTAGHAHTSVITGDNHTRDYLINKFDM